MVALTKSYSFKFVGIGDLSSVCWSTGAQLIIFFASNFQWCCLAVKVSATVTLQVPRHCVYYENTPMQYTAIFKAVKMTIFSRFFFTFFIFLLITYIVGTR